MSCLAGHGHITDYHAHRFIIAPPLNKVVGGPKWCNGRERLLIGQRKKFCKRGCDYKPVRMVYKVQLIDDIPVQMDTIRPTTSEITRHTNDK